MTASNLRECVPSELEVDRHILIILDRNVSGEVQSNVLTLANIAGEH